MVLLVRRMGSLGLANWRVWWTYLMSFSGLKHSWFPLALSLTAVAVHYLAKQWSCSVPTVRYDSFRAIGRVLRSPWRLTVFVFPLLFPRLFPDLPTYRHVTSLPPTADEVLWWSVSEASAGCVLGGRHLLGRLPETKHLTREHFPTFTLNGKQIA